MNLAFLNLTAEQRGRKHDTSRLVTYLLSRWKRRLQAQRMQQDPLFTPLGLHCHQSLHFLEAFSRFSPLSVGPAIGGDWVAIPSQIFRDSCESCRKTKGLQRGERRGKKGTSRHVVSDTCSHFVSWSLADWEPSFCLYSDMVPKFSHLRSYWTRLWTT